MRKQEFLDRLRKGLAGLPKRDIEERLGFYSEMIDDRIEEGLSEEEAVSGVGSVEEIAAQIVGEAPLSKKKSEADPKRKMRAWEIVLLVLGSPIWFSLAVAAIAVAFSLAVAAISVFFSLYVVIWSVLISLWAVFASLAAGALGGAVAGILFILQGSALSGVALIASGAVCAGLAIFLFFWCRMATKALTFFTPKIASGMKRCFAKKEARR